LGIIAATPGDTVPPTGFVVLRVSATDEDGDQLSFSWSASAGIVAPATGDSVVWTAPPAPVTATITVICSDGNNGADTATKELVARTWFTGEVAGETPDSTYLPAPGTVLIPFTFDTAIAAGAVVDSLFLTTKFEPADLETLNFNVYLVSPQGTEVLIYDGIELTTLEVSDLNVSGFTGEAAAGTWKLKVARPSVGLEGYAEDCELEIYYHY
ncbi:MAG: proprotein convertase P-domain-containing protein, partial [candidate division WOR-3 bacterium]